MIENSYRATAPRRRFQTQRQVARRGLQDVCPAGGRRDREGGQGQRPGDVPRFPRLGRQGPLGRHQVLHHPLHEDQAHRAGRREHLGKVDGRGLQAVHDGQNPLLRRGGVGSCQGLARRGVKCRRSRSLLPEGTCPRALILQPEHQPGDRSVTVPLGKRDLQRRSRRCGCGWVCSSSGGLSRISVRPS